MCKLKEFEQANGGHRYDGRCRCANCVDFEFYLKVSIAKESEQKRAAKRESGSLLQCL